MTFKKKKRYALSDSKNINNINCCPNLIFKKNKIAF